jgi:hypothetical protein
MARGANMVTDTLTPLAPCVKRAPGLATDSVLGKQTWRSYQIRIHLATWTEARELLRLLGDVTIRASHLVSKMTNHRRRCAQGSPTVMETALRRDGKDMGQTWRCDLLVLVQTYEVATGPQDPGILLTAPEMGTLAAHLQALPYGPTKDTQDVPGQPPGRPRGSPTGGSSGQLFVVE